MKNTMYLVLSVVALVFAAGTAYAGGSGNGFYVGAAAIGSGCVVDSGGNTDKLDGDSNFSGGIYAGYKHRIFKGMFVAGEAFFHDTSQDETFSDGDRLELDSQYGVTAHIGYEWDSWSVYGILGAAALDYEITQNGDKTSDDHFRALLGGGATYQYSKKISTNLEVTTCGDEIDIAGDKNKTLGLVTLRLGVSYHF